MNSNARSLRLQFTNYTNPHRLENPLNESTALDLARLAAHCMKIPIFAEIVRKSNYTCLIRKEGGGRKTCKWINTNKLMAKGFNGVKTGMTYSAGPCLVSSYKDTDHEFIMVVLCCKTPADRWFKVMNMKNNAMKILKEKNTKLPQIKEITIKGRLSKTKLKNKTKLSKSFM